MSSLPQKPQAGQKLETILEKHDAREAYNTLAAQIILANRRIRDTPLPPSETRVQTESHKVTLTAKDLDDIKPGRFGRFQLPSEDEARYRVSGHESSARHSKHVPLITA